jgi:hypothetical protein
MTRQLCIHIVLLVPFLFFVSDATFSSFGNEHGLDLLAKFVYLVLRVCDMTEVACVQIEETVSSF